MEYKIGNIITGIISGIKNYGIFIKFDDTYGFCHISNLSHEFISNIYDKYQMGQEVKGKIINISEDNKIEISLKVLLNKSEPNSNNSEPFEKTYKYNSNINTKESKNNSFEDMMNKYLKNSKERLDCISARSKRKYKR